MVPARRLPARFLPTAALGVLLLAGCGVSAAGAGGATAPQADLSALPACSLVSDADATAAGLRAPGRAAAGGGAQSCAWTPAGGAVIGVPVVLTVLPGASLDAVSDLGGVTGPFADTEIAGRPARTSGPGLCAVFVDVGGGALGVAGGTECATVERVAELAVGTLSG